MALADWFSWKQALIVQTIFYSLALLQQDFFLGQLWFIINCFTLLLLRAAYSDSPSGRLMAWYIYCLSIFTDILSLSVFGHDLDEDGDVYTFVLVMAIFLLIPKPLFAFFLHYHLREQGVDVKQGVKYNPLSEQMVNQSDNNMNRNNDYVGSVSISTQQQQQQQLQQQQQQQQYFGQQSNTTGNYTQDFLDSDGMHTQPPIQNNVQQSSNGYNATPGQFM
jgi:hypothetical protein